VVASGILPEEAYYLVSKSKAAYLLAGKGCRANAARVCEFAEAQGDNLTLLPISSDAKPEAHDTKVDIDNNLQRDPRSPGILLFTSGTTGRPKGVVLPLRCLSFPEGLQEPGGVAVAHRACHWIAGTVGLLRPF
jgi:malonyl-CoA/methylmalonyl-CoA synthetase